MIISTVGAVNTGGLSYEDSLAAMKETGYMKPKASPFSSYTTIWVLR